MAVTELFQSLREARISDVEVARETGVNRNRVRLYRDGAVGVYDFKEIANVALFAQRRGIAFSFDRVIGLASTGGAQSVGDHYDEMETRIIALEQQLSSRINNIERLLAQSMFPGLADAKPGSTLQEIGQKAREALNAIGESPLRKGAARRRKVG